MKLGTQLEHIVSENELKTAMAENEHLMVCCGRMGPMCLPVYKAMEDLRDKYQHVKFMDMAFDLPDARAFRELPECKGFMGLPYTVYYKKGKVVAATTSIQSKEQVMSILNREFGK